MPSSLAEAFGAPISLLNVSKTLYDKESNSIMNSTDSSTNSIKNPNYSPSTYQFQNNYKINSISDLETMADDINNLYHPVTTNTNTNTNTTNTNTKNFNDNTSNTNNTNNNKKNFNDNECDTLISRVLSCSYCRKKLMNYFNNGIQTEMKGGGKNLSNIIDVKLIINIFIGIVFIYIFDILMK